MASSKGRNDHEKLGELIHGIRTAMLVTLDDGGLPRSRPMSTQETDFDGSLWFFTSVDSHKVRHIEGNPRVHLSYSSPSSEQYIAVDGRAEVLDDRAKAKELWSVFLKAWFEGPDDPKLRLIRVDVERAEYWDSPGGTIGSMLSIAKAIVTGKPDDGGHGTMRLAPRRRGSGAVSGAERPSMPIPRKSARKQATSR
jgi:general stress protein 26